MYEDYVVVSVKMPRGLKEKIDQLARKGDRTRNGWIVRKLASDARWGIGVKGKGKK